MGAELAPRGGGDDEEEGEEGEGGFAEEEEPTRRRDVGGGNPNARNGKRTDHSERLRYGKWINRECVVYFRISVFVSRPNSVLCSRHPLVTPDSILKNGAL